jgi:murein DD-endopeptidase MepM/ murein hydrolase activator NlpD
VNGVELNGWDEWHSFYIIHGSMNNSIFVPNGYSTWYLHVDNLDPHVSDGNFVQKGHPVALSGSRRGYVRMEVRVTVRGGRFGLRLKM